MKESRSLLQRILLNGWPHCLGIMSLGFILRGCLLDCLGTDPGGRQGLHVQREEERLSLPEPYKAVGRKISILDGFQDQQPMAVEGAVTRRQL